MNDRLPCGHHTACVVSTDEGTHYCGRCEEVARLLDDTERLQAEIDRLQANATAREGLLRRRTDALREAERERAALRSRSEEDPDA